MSTPRIPLNEIAVAVQNAVQQTLAKHGAVPIDQLWVGFVAPEKLATPESARLVADALAKAEGVQAQPSVAQLAGGAVGEAQGLVPHRIIGLVFNPKTLK